MTSRTVNGMVWTHAYNAENQLISTHKDNQLISEYGYDGDGKRVAEINADGTATIFIGNYFEGAYPEPEPPAQPPQPSLPSLPYKAYLPVVSKGGISFEPITARFGTLYFYADGERIAMKKDGEVYYLYGDQLGSVSAVADADGNQISKTLYHPWGTTRHTQGTSPTDYAFTGQMKEGDIYFYNAHWPQVPETKWRGYDPQLGRFMQADTLVPPQQGTQGFDRYAYVNNNPLRYNDHSGFWLCDMYEPGCYENADEKRAFDLETSKTFNEPFYYTVSGSYDFGIGQAKSIDRYSDDLISSTIPITPSTFPLSLIDLIVRIGAEFGPQPINIPQDDLFYSMTVLNNESILEIEDIYLISPVESVVLIQVQVFNDKGFPIHLFTPKGIAQTYGGYHTGEIGTFQIMPSNIEGLPFSISIVMLVTCYDCGGIMELRGPQMYSMRLD